MNDTCLREWLKSRRPIAVDGLRLRPREHPAVPGTLLSIKKGQAETFLLHGDDGSEHVLKKFHQGRAPDRSYLESIQRVLPEGEPFIAGKKRQVISNHDLRKERGCHHSQELAAWLNDTVLLPRVRGSDWSGLADEIRDGTISMDTSQRLTLCRSLAVVVVILEGNQCSHRDLSSGNVFIDTADFSVYLIDFDSLFHPILPYPTATTCGTTGYTPPLAWRGNQPDASATWCQRADRFALALLIAEFLILERGSPLTAEGGLFEQDELRNRGGAGLGLALGRLNQSHAQAADLLQRALFSTSFDQCPAPQEWFQFCEGTLAPLNPPPPLSQVPDPFTQGGGRVFPIFASPPLPADPWQN